MRVKVQKLREQFDADFADRAGTPCAGNARLFEGVNVWVDGATTPSRDQIRELVGTRAGRLETYLIPDCVTHVVCETLAQATRLRLRKMVDSKRISVVTPRWITDSIATDKILPTAQYPVSGMTDPSQRSIASFFRKPN
jgi:BRCT domain, a BRCA1 C-terminus domain